MSNAQVWIVMLYLLAMTIVWVTEKEDDPDVHVKRPVQRPKKKGEKNNKK